MMRTRWLKLWRDAQDTPGRLLLTIIALGTSLLGVTAMLTTFTVLRREVPRSFLAALPASARLSVDGTVPDSVLQTVRARTDIARADVAGRASAQLILRNGESVPMLLFVTPAIGDLRVDAVRVEERAGHAAAGLMIERSALALTQAAVGDSLTVVLSTGRRARVPVSGVVHDPGVAPAWQEQVIYAYATAETMQALGAPVTLDQLKLVVRDSTAPLDAIDGIVHDVTEMLTARGLVVRAAQVPPARQHPHQPQMNAIVTMLLIFSLLGVILGAVLTATVISALLAQQVRQLAIMKAIGASTQQLTSMYFGVALVLGVISTAVALPLGMMTGRALVRAVATLLNLRIASFDTPAWASVVTVVLGLATPILAAVLPVRRATQRTVRDAIDEHGARATGDGGVLATLAERVRVADVAGTLALRNAVRRRSRLLMTAGLLAAAGAMLIASLDLRAAWDAKVRTAISDRRYDVELHLRDAVPDTLLSRVLATTPGVMSSEGWSATGATREVVGQSAGIGRVHADGGHGALTYRMAPPATALIAHRMAAGRWLTEADSDAVVLNTMAGAQIFADVRTGDRISLRINDTIRVLTVVGQMHEPLTQATAYVTPARFARDAGIAGKSSAIRLRLTDRRADAVRLTVPQIVQTLSAAGVPVRRVLTSERMAAAQGGHVYILVAALAAIAFAMAVTGLVGLASALGSSVFERTREFGVMRALGASRSVILRSVMFEGLCMAALSLVPAVIISRLLAGVVGGVLASVAQQDLQLMLTLPSVLSWAALLMVASIVVSAVPASRAASLTVRDAISHT